MRLKFSEFLALASFIGWFINYMKFKKTWAKWLFGLVCLGSVIYIIFSNDKDSGGTSQTATTTGSNPTVIQAAPGSTVNTTINPDRATNPVVEGDFNTVYGNVPHNIHGSGNTIIGATDSHGNTIITQSMAVGFNAHAGPGSIAIGANAGAGTSAPAITNQ